MNVYLKFRKDLQEGLSIEEALTKYNLELKQVFNYFTVPKKKKKKQKSYLIDRNIFKVKGYYHIRYKKSFYGSYNSLEDAQKVRDKLIENKWNKLLLNKILTELSINKNPRGGIRK